MPRHRYQVTGAEFVDNPAISVDMFRNRVENLSARVHGGWAIPYTTNAPLTSDS